MVQIDVKTNHLISNTSSMKLRTEKNLKILAILFLIIPPILITISFTNNCFDEGECEEPLRYLGPKLTQNLISISGVYLATSTFGILIAASVMISGTLSSSTILIIGIIPWLVGILINTFTNDFSKWRILYIWIIITQISYITFFVHPFPISPV